jgi:hypothetical protein
MQVQTLTELLLQYIMSLVSFADHRYVKNVHTVILIITFCCVVYPCICKASVTVTCETVL